MSQFEYKVIPAPTKAKKARAASPDARYAMAVSDVLNEEAQNGWDFQRAETLPCEERQGLTGKATVFRTLLVFRRDVGISETDATRQALLTVRDPEDTL